ncbi:MAG: PstS family phosphate ABC transporter substrate-binding protein, partial [Halioglobus sp.]|nr:PstS family phosphate ABC transporter substrate-binding protein [Halioglobus sp.]
GLCLLLCTAIPRAEPAVLRLAGSTTLLPVLEKLARDFGRSQRDTEIRLEGGGSGRGIEALLAGEVEIAASSRFLQPAEIDRFQDSGVLPVPFRVAYDAIIPIVHKRNRVKSLSMAQLKKIYHGEIDNWRQVGGADRPIVVVTRDSGSGTFQVWQEQVTGGDSTPAGGLRAASTDAVVRHVAGRRGAIGYIGLASLNASVKPLRVDGVMGSIRNVHSGSYPLGRPLFLFTAGWPADGVLEFINFAVNPSTGQRVVEAAGFVPLHR